MKVDWGRLLVGQLEDCWDVHLRPRLDGLTDEEYFWEPVDGCWSLRRAEDGSHHGAEICLLRDLYRATGTTTRDSQLIPQRQKAPPF